jgi:L-threonylcarbamoyladenylate synthase
VRADLAGRVDIILDAGSTPVGVESTVLSLVTATPTILRPGGTSREALRDVLGTVAVGVRTVAEGERAISPGTTLKHYAPHARLTLYLGDRDGALAAMRAAAEAQLAEGERVGVLVAEGDLPVFSSLSVVTQSVGPAEALSEIAQRLYASLRKLDKAGVTVILAREFGTAGLGLAIRDRLTRAAAGRVVRVSDHA